MQVTIQGSGRRVKLTKTERAKLAAAKPLLDELGRQCNDVAARVGAENIGYLLTRIDADGLYTEPKPEQSDA